MTFVLLNKPSSTPPITLPLSTITQSLPLTHMPYPYALPLAPIPYPNLLTPVLNLQNRELCPAYSDAPDLAAVHLRRLLLPAPSIDARLFPRNRVQFPAPAAAHGSRCRFPI